MAATNTHSIQTPPRQRAIPGARPQTPPASRDPKAKVSPQSPDFSDSDYDQGLEDSDWDALWTDISSTNALFCQTPTKQQALSAGDLYNTPPYSATRAMPVRAGLVGTVTNDEVSSKDFKQDKVHFEKSLSSCSAEISALDMPSSPCKLQAKPHLPTSPETPLPNSNSTCLLGPATARSLNSEVVSVESLLKTEGKHLEPKPIFTLSDYHSSKFGPSIESPSNYTISGYCAQYGFDFTAMKKNSIESYLQKVGFTPQVKSIRGVPDQYITMKSSSSLAVSSFKNPLADSNSRTQTVTEFVPSSYAQSSKQNGSVELQDDSGLVEHQSSCTTVLQASSTCCRDSNKSRNVEGSVLSETHVTETRVESRTLARILPFNTLQRILLDPGRCVASKVSTPYPRCKCKTKLTIHKAKDILESISRRKTPLTTSAALQNVEELITIAVCTAYHTKIAKEELEDLRLMLGVVESKRAKKFLRYKSETQAVVLAAFPYWVKSLTTVPETIEEEEIVSSYHTAYPNGGPKARSTIEVKQTETAAIRTTNASSATLTRSTRTNAEVRKVQNFMPYCPTTTSRLSPAECIRQKLQQRLSPSDMTDGYVYMYWYPGKFGFVKIGYTGKSIPVRLAEWKAQCKHAADAYLEDGLPQEIRVPHARRVETLVHAELKDRRVREENCPGCRGNHIEWFDVSAQTARKVIKKWSDWMLTTRPYEDGVLRTSISDAEIERLCQTIELTTPILPSNVKRSPPRKTKTELREKKRSEKRLVPKVVKTEESESASAREGRYWTRRKFPVNNKQSTGPGEHKYWTRSKVSPGRSAVKAAGLDLSLQSQTKGSMEPAKTDQPEIKCERTDPKKAIASTASSSTNLDSVKIKNEDMPVFGTDTSLPQLEES